MMDDNKFINEMWNKYKQCTTNSNSQKDFFGKVIYRNSNFILYTKSLTFCLIVFVFTVLISCGVYATISSTLKSFDYVQETSEVIYPVEDYLNDMTFSSTAEVYYKVVTTYDEYKNIKNNSNNFIDMNENEFENYVLIFLYAPPKTSRVGLYIDNIETTNDCLNIYIGRNEDKYNELVFAKLKREKYRDKIELTFLEKIPNMTNYCPMKDLPDDYTIEQAIEDNCVVIEDGKYMNRPTALKDFIEKTEKGLEDNIRIVNYQGDKHQFGTIITDISFQDGMYVVCADRSMATPLTLDQNIDDIRYLVSDKILMRTTTNNGIIEEMYSIHGNHGGQELIMVRHF